MPVAEAQNPKEVLCWGASAELYETGAKVARVPRTEEMALQAWLSDAWFSSTTADQLETWEELRLVNATDAQYPLPQSACSVSAASTPPDETADSTSLSSEGDGSAHAERERTARICTPMTKKGCRMIRF